MRLGAVLGSASRIQEHFVLGNFGKCVANTLPIWLFLRIQSVVLLWETMTTIRQPVHCLRLLLSFPALQWQCARNSMIIPIHKPFTRVPLQNDLLASWLV